MSRAGHGDAMPPPFNGDMQRRIAIIVIAILAVTASLAAYYRGNGSTDAPKYTTAVAVRGDVVEAVDATGTLGAVMTVQVGTQVSGTIKSLHADFNSIVKKGQVIARLDSSLFQAQVDQAEATIARLQADVERARVSLERQVRIVAGAIAATGSFVALFAWPPGAWIPALIGSGLVFAGVSDTCTMGMLLAKLPYNRGAATCDTESIVRQFLAHESEPRL